jgi:predicted RND superfamily exporter protein
MWRLLDLVADWLRDQLGARAQLRAGILIVLISTLWTIWAMATTDEPINVLAMSGVALILTGIGIVVGAQVLEQGENGDED